ncbi:uncharacterized protein KGF55_004967 [Candida pseudojiufengensis]|uniref:uncharacterized protein n=1 Tax=Candida pseudojiufengensis TaxID=497109 RepID=UPI002224FEAA|nr:uncharacterized protein KGF55_004967 [Candida pseudojiufengensis]KAI5959735.1 hypothetical protein KGF55_004967 [Candida pseudojiufengensis]
MAKRKHIENSKSSSYKKQKPNSSTTLDPNTSGIYVTCARNKEKLAIEELMSILSEKVEDLIEKSDDEDNDETKKELSIEEKIKAELLELEVTTKNKKSNLLQPSKLDCECVVFIKTKKPIDPVKLVYDISKDCYNSGVKNTRYTQKLTPITDSCSATGENPTEQLKLLSQRILKPHFHNEKDQKPIKFAIQVSRKNFSILTSDEIKKLVAETIGRDHNHTVDLKNYDKLIIVECYKTNVGMSVVEDYLKYSKFNLQQIYDKTIKS